MVLLGDSIRYTNVISKRYRYHYRDMNEVMESFINDVVKANGTVKGPLFYAIHNVPLDEMLNAEFFMPVYEDRVDLQDDMKFHSYFNIEGMVTYCVFDQFETSTEAAYGILMQYMETSGLRQTTPIFHVVSGDQSQPYIFIKIGIVPEEKEEPVWR